MTKRYKLAALIGRYEPLHNGHISNIMQALEVADKIHILLGSSYQPRTIKNPFTFQERQMVITKTLLEMGIKNDRFVISPIKDFSYNDNLWIQGVQESVKNYNGEAVNDADIAIMGHEKDDSSWYLRAFPSWNFIPLDAYVEHGSRAIDATKIRELYFEGNLDYISGAVPKTVFDFLVRFSKSAEYKTLIEEYNFITEYKKAWSVAPYAPTFFTVDAVVIQGGHILLVKRKFAPGKGLWALPGGFLNQKETARTACIRELKEETKLKVPSPVLNGSITYEQLFDKPDRSLRGRTLTQAFLIELNTGESTLPAVKGSDDAAEARWFKISEVLNMSESIFEDHHSIIQTMVGRAK